MAPRYTFDPRKTQKRDKKPLDERRVRGGDGGWGKGGIYLNRCECDIREREEKRNGTRWGRGVGGQRGGLKNENNSAGA